jgi:phosphatidylserine decarboxylase
MKAHSRPVSLSNKAVALGAAAASLAVISLAYFLRDPERQPPNDPRAILAPADGRVLLVETAAAPAFVAGPAWRIVIFLSLWDVHVQRAPAAGRVALSESQAGGFAPAFEARAAHNAGHRLGLEAARGRVLVVRTSGLVARRVTTTVALGQTLRAGQRIGRILLGSRAEVFLPWTAAVRVQPGEHVRAGETVLATWDEGDAGHGHD